MEGMGGKWGVGGHRGWWVKLVRHLSNEHTRCENSRRPEQQRRKDIFMGS